MKPNFAAPPLCLISAGSWDVWSHKEACWSHGHAVWSRVWCSRHWLLPGLPDMTKISEIYEHRIWSEYDVTNLLLAEPPDMMKISSSSSYTPRSLFNTPHFCCILKTKTWICAMYSEYYKVLSRLLYLRIIVHITVCHDANTCDDGYQDVYLLTPNKSAHINDKFKYSTQRDQMQSPNGLNCYFIGCHSSQWVT